MELLIILFIFISPIILKILLEMCSKIQTQYFERERNKLLLDKMEQMEDIIHNLVNKHIDTLVRKRAQMLRKDDYGNLIIKDWCKELEYFLREVIIPKLDAMQCELLAENEDYILNDIIEERISLAHEEYDKKLDFSNSMSPSEFEYFCAQELCKQGWDAHPTKISGDQGIDVIAKKKGLILVMQCKKYTAPVGNKAVQEIIAGKNYENADIACVVSTCSYTKSAYELASKTGVILLHYHDLHKIDNIISKNSKAGYIS